MKNFIITKKQFNSLMNEQVKITINKQFKKVVTESVKKLIRENDRKNELISIIKQEVEKEGDYRPVQIERDYKGIGDMKIIGLSSDGFYYEIEDPMKYHKGLESADLLRAQHAYNKHKDAKKYQSDIKNILDRPNPERVDNYDEEQFMSYNDADVDLLEDILYYIESENEYNDSINSEKQDDEDDDTEEYYNYLNSL